MISLAVAAFCAEPAHAADSTVLRAQKTPSPAVYSTNTPLREIGSGEKQMLEMINAARSDPANSAETKGRACPLRWDPRLARAALAHSQEMAARHYFGHIDPGGDSPVERIYHAGVQWTALGENIGRGASALTEEANFMSEPPFQPNHRANILSAKFNCVGIGFARGADGLLYVTQDFAQEPK